MTLIPASDGILGREVRPWSEDKLYYVDRLLKAVTGSMRGKWGDLVYADFFSGPGINIGASSRTEHRGSPLIALSLPFTRFYFSDGDCAVIDALKQRITAAEPDPPVLAEVSDCNDAPDRAKKFLFEDRARSTLGVSLIDPYGYEITFDSIRRFTAGIHTDLIITFMTDFPRRFRSQPGFQVGCNLQRFMGIDDHSYTALITRPLPRGTTRAFLDAYKNQLSTLGYDHVDDGIQVKNDQGRTLYHLLYASRHPLGKQLSENIRMIGPKRQREMF